LTFYSPLYQDSVKLTTVATVPITAIDLARGAYGAIPPSKFLENIVILCFERRYGKQNNIIHLKSNIRDRTNFCPPVFGLATPLNTVHYSETCNDFHRLPDVIVTPHPRLNHFPIQA